MNIYVLGYMTSAYRSEGYIKCFLDSGINNIYINNYNSKKSLLKKIADFLMLLKSDIVFILPLQHSNRMVKFLKLLNKKYIVDFYISYYDSSVFDYDKYNQYSTEAKKLKKLDIDVLINADLAIFLNKSERHFYLERLGLNNSSVSSTIIPLYNPKKSVRSSLPFFQNKNKVLKICWTGTYIPLHGLDKIIKAISIFNENYGEGKVELILWGDSERKSKPYRDLVNQLNIKKSVQFINTNWGNIEKWNSFMSENCDVSLGVFGDSIKSQVVLPNKVLDGVALKVPVLTQPSKALTEFGLDDFLYVSENVPKKISEKIYYLYNCDITEIRSNIVSSYNIYRENFIYDSFKNRVEQELTPFLKGETDNE